MTIDFKVTLMWSFDVGEVRHVVYQWVELFAVSRDKQDKSNKIQVGVP